MNNTLAKPVVELNEIPRELEHLSEVVSRQQEILTDLESRLNNVVRPLPVTGCSQQPPQPAPVSTNLGNDIHAQRERLIGINNRLIALLDGLAL